VTRLLSIQLYNWTCSIRLWANHLRCT